MSEKPTGTWRLPTKEELKKLCEKLGEEAENEFYWSSTTIACSSTSYAWAVYFGNGSTDYGGKTSSLYVRCVRDTENGLEWSEKASARMNWYDAMEYAEEMNEEIT